MKKATVKNVVAVSVGLFLGSVSMAHAAGPGKWVGPQAGKPVCTMDDSGTVYNLSVSNGTITGTADHPDCGRYDFVSGTYYSNGKMELHVGGSALCSGYSMEGVVDPQTKTIAGFWESDDSVSGKAWKGTFDNEMDDEKDNEKDDGSSGSDDGKNGSDDGSSGSDDGKNGSDDGSSGSDGGTSGGDDGSSGSDGGSDGSDDGSSGSDGGSDGSDDGSSGSDGSNSGAFTMNMCS